ncbi:hypothetical protein [Lysinibacillus parviboronicapiens]|uniref:hypothetical protein n=1 Tax=Lysinibacillus parviboronicapiens TaxID=436516 RepID=UPI00142E5FD6|nr:hypothetical protein [Lysinibacillus parviboronicapiens]
MNIKKYLLSFNFGYVLALIIVFFLFDYFSWSFAVGSLLGIGIFGLLIKILTRRNH